MEGARVLKQRTGSTLAGFLSQVSFLFQRKCEQYWPERVGETISPDGGVSVLLKSVLPFAEYEIRELVLTNVRVDSTRFALLHVWCSLLTRPALLPTAQ